MCGGSSSICIVVGGSIQVGVATIATGTTLFIIIIIIITTTLTSFIISSSSCC